MNKEQIVTKEEYLKMENKEDFAAIPVYTPNGEKLALLPLLKPKRRRKKDS